MSDSGKLENPGKEAREAVENGENIREAMRRITLSALSRGRLDGDGMKRVVHSVVQGASMGVADAGDKSRLALNEALAGIDEALAKSADASRLAVEEAAGRLRDYGKHDLQRAFNDIQALESMFLDTVKEVAETSAGSTRQILHGLLQHARASGTSAGAAASDAITVLERKLGRTLHDVAAAGSDAALNTGSNLAEAASGFLAGIAEALDAKSQNMRNKERQG